MNNRSKRMFPAGHVGLAIMLLGGIWLLIAPAWVGFSAHRLQSRIDEWAGAAVIIASVVTFVLQWAFGLGELVRGRAEDKDYERR